MARLSEKTIKKLFALSGNVCAYPGCSAQIIAPGGEVVGEICHIAARSPGGPRYNAAQTPHERDGYENLILLCGEHHKVVDASPEQWTSPNLTAIKDIRESLCGRAERSEDGFAAKKLIERYASVHIAGNSGNISINSPGSIQAQTVSIRTNRKIVFSPPPGTVGADQDASRYIQYLISRYNKFASQEPSRKTKFNYGVISRNIADKFGAEWRLLPLARSNTVFEYLHARIRKTRLAKNNSAVGKRSFASYEEFVARQEVGA